MKKAVDMKAITLGVVEARYFAAKGDDKGSMQILQNVFDMINAAHEDAARENGGYSKEAVKAYTDGVAADLKDYGFEV